MKTQKLYSKLYLVEDWIEYYKGASKRELKATLKDLKNHLDTRKRNQKDAIIALLA